MQIRNTNMEQWRGLYNGAWNAVVNNNVQTRPDGGGSMSIKERFFLETSFILNSRMMI